MNNKRKILVPLATLLAAGAVAVGSGATFTSSSTSGDDLNIVTSGTLTQENTKDGEVIFTHDNLKPGDTVTGTATVTNDGTLPATFTLTESEADNTFSSGNLSLKVTNTDTLDVLHNGEFGTAGEMESIVVEPGDSNTYTFVVALAASADNDEQGKSANATYTWDSVQLSGNDYVTS